jgi:hypothetical protein
MNSSLPIFAAEKSEGKPDEFAAVKRADEEIPGRFTGNGQRERKRIVIAHAPNFFFYRFQLAEVFDAFEIANRNVLRVLASHYRWPFARRDRWRLGMAITVGFWH